MSRIKTELFTAHYHVRAIGALPALERALSDPDYEVRLCAVEALKRCRR